eukprot:symbB.v1.2.036193.t1/scaffold5051.1/size31436/2
MRPYQQQADEMKDRYTEDLDRYQKEDNEELLLGSASGGVTRIKVSSVLVTERVVRGRVVAKTKSDRIRVATLLSSMDGDPEEGNKTSPSQAASQSTQISTQLSVAPAEPAAVVVSPPTASAPRAAAPPPKAAEVVEKAPENVVEMVSAATASPLSRRRRLSLSQLQQLRSPCFRAPVASMSKLKATLRVIKNPFIEKPLKVKQSKLDFRELLKRSGPASTSGR